MPEVYMYQFITGEFCPRARKSQSPGAIVMFQNCDDREVYEVDIYPQLMKHIYPVTKYDVETVLQNLSFANSVDLFYDDGGYRVKDFEKFLQLA